MPHSELYIDGVWYPSVTTITSSKPMPWLQAWKDKWGVLAERKTKIANAVGTEFHRCVEEWINTRHTVVLPPHVDGVTMPSLIPRVEGMLKSWIRWALKIDGTIVHTELPVLSKRHVYSGTLDAVGTMDGRPMLFDWKTSQKIYDDMELQLAAYAHAFNEQYSNDSGEAWPPVKLGIIVCVSKDKPAFKLTTRQFKLGKLSFSRFLKLRKAFDEMKARESNAETTIS
jgi:hypothetical protein